MEVVHLAEHLRRRGVDRDGALNVEFGWLERDDDREHENERHQHKQDLLQHRMSLPERSVVPGAVFIGPYSITRSPRYGMSMTFTTGSIFTFLRAAQALSLIHI